MPRVYSQTRRDRNMVVIAEHSSLEVCRNVVANCAVQWIKSKPGRTAKGLGNLEMGLHFSDGKLAGLMWVDPVPAPVGENKFAPATGEVPGLKGCE